MNSSEKPEQQDILNEVRRELMRGIDQRLREQYPTQLAAEEALDINQPRLSYLRNGLVEHFSIPWLLVLAVRVGLKVKITVE